MLRAASRVEDAMSGEHRCKCGFSSVSATTIHRHFRRFKDEREDHALVRPGDEALDDGAPAAGAEDPVPLESSDEGEPDRESPAQEYGAVLGRLSLAGGLASLWSSARAQKAPEVADDGATADEGVQHEGVAATVLTGRAPGGKDSDGDTGSPWEHVPDEYLNITDSLQGSEREPIREMSWLTTSMRKVLGQAGQASGDEATSPERKLTDVNSTGPGGEEVSVEDLEKLLLWSVPFQTAKVFGAGLYILICFRHLVNGVELLQPSSAFALAGITIMVYCSAKSLLGRQDLSGSAYERALQKKVEGLVGGVISRIAPVVSSVASLVARRLSVRSSKASRVWLGLCLWMVICVGELGWVTQSSLALWAWGALFSLPGLYVTCRAALDALVDESILFVLSAIRGGQRGTLLASGVLGLLAFAVVEAKFFMRVSVALLASGAVVLWQAHRLRIKTAATPR